MRLHDGAFCYEVAAPGLVPTGNSLRYTLDLPIGLQRAKAAGLEVPIEPDELRDLVTDRIDDPEMTAGDLALLMWADSRAGMSAMDAIAFRLHKKLGADLPDLEGLELSWLVIGTAEAEHMSSATGPWSANWSERAPQPASLRIVTRAVAPVFPTSRPRSTVCWRSLWPRAAVT